MWKDQFLRLQESTLELYKTTECKVSHGCAMLSRQGAFIMAVRPRFKVARVGRENLRFYADMEEEELGGAAVGGGSVPAAAGASSAEEAVGAAGAAEAQAGAAETGEEERQGESYLVYYSTHTHARPKRIIL